MLEAIKRNWRSLMASPPGRRFQERYFRNRSKRKRQNGWQRWLKLGGGLAVCLAGVFLMPAPGPGWGVFILGAAMISDEFLFIARFLDWAELRVNPYVQNVKMRWKNASRTERTAVYLVIAACSVTAGYAIYWWFAK
jgi:uncharacterized protein (TIGR02611 family)